MNARPKAVASMSAGGLPVFSRPRDMSAVCGKFAEDAVLSMEKVADMSCTLPGGAAYSYSAYSTFEESAFTGTGAGNVRPWIVSPHVVASAAHYGGLNRTGPISLAGVSAVRGTWVSLRTWALANGFSAAEVGSAADVGDIMLCPCSSASGFPASAVPLFAGAKRRRRMFRRDTWDGMLAWQSPQVSAAGVQYAVPVSMRGDRAWSSAFLCPERAPERVRAKLSSALPSYRTYVGDSGKPVYLMVDGAPVVVSQSHSVSSAGGVPVTTGPDMSAAVPMLRAYVGSVGDRLLEI